MSKQELQGLSSDSPAGSDIDQKHPEAFADNETPSDTQSEDVQIGQPVAFLSNGLTEHYTPIDSYEGRHRFDPKFQWTTEEETRLIRRVRLPAR